MKKSLLVRKVKAITFCFSLLYAASLFSQIHAQNITGKVFRDFDANGQQTSISPIEPAVAGVTVKAFNANGTQAGSTATTLADGTYTIAVGTTSQVRVEFSNFPTSFYSGPKGLNSGTSIQFVNGGDTANLGINYPSDFCGASPKLVTPCYVNGTPLNGGDSANEPFIVTIPYTPTGNGTAGSTSENAYLSKGAEVGATWGMAYQRSSKFIFTSALLKRHSGFGLGGPGAIYKIDISGTTQFTTLFVDLKADLGIDVGIDSRNQASAVDSLSNIKTQPNHDSTAFGNIGKVSLGAIEISDDEKTMWVINTFDKKLYELPIGSPAIKPTTKIAHTLPDPGCANGVFRPWAVKFWRGKVYVGGVCTAEKSGGTNADLQAYIYSFIPGDANPDNFTQVISFPLNYPRGVTSVDGFIQNSAAWKPWIAKWSDITNPIPGAGAFNQTICPQPILSDIEFDVDGSMIVNFMDRAGHQFGNKNYSPNKDDFLTYEGVSAGDLLRIGFSNGTYTLENNATVNGIVSGGNNQSPSQGPGNGEFYWQDMYSKNANKDLPSLVSGSGHQEISLGGLAILLGNNEVAETVFDPELAPRAGGIRWFDNTNGSSPRGYEVFGQDAGGQGATFGKANGLGDLELLCASQPIEVGNRFWNDIDKDGIQDAGEPVLTGITVELWKGGVKVETKITDTITGEYYFSGLVANSVDYEIRVPNINGVSKQTQLAGLMLTTTKAGTNNEIDSDAIVSETNTYASISFSTGNAGENDHTLDAGFVPILIDCKTEICVPFLIKRLEK
jgi:trimeric autotransporter adhesin